MTLDWVDLNLNGMPAIHRVLRYFDTALTQQEQDIRELQYLMSEELLVSLVRQPEFREVVEELGHGWRIERQPAEPNGSGATSVPPAVRPAATPPRVGETTTVEDIDRQFAGIKRLSLSMKSHFGG